MEKKSQSLYPFFEKREKRRNKNTSSKKRKETRCCQRGEKVGLEKKKDSGCSE